MRDDDCVDLDSHSRYGHKWMKLSCFRDGASKGLVCEAENPDFFLSN